MIADALSRPLEGLLTICALAAAMELLAKDGRAAPAFRSVCSLAVATCAARLLAHLLGA